MLRYLFVRRTDWTVLVIACTLSLSMMLLEARLQARVAWFLQHTLLAPFEVTVGWVDQSVGVFWENHQLRSRLTQLQIESDALQGERMENVRLRRLLHLEERHPYNLVAASVVARSLDRLGGSLTIDKGTADGVEPGRAVLTPDGLVGRAERSTPHETRVLTLLNRDCAVAARIERTRVDGVLEWEFGNQPVLNLRYISSQEDVKVGDRVVTSGLGGIFPVGIRIGTVAKVALDPNGLMKEILVDPAVDFRSVEEILVYTPSDLRGTAPADLFLEEPKPAAAADSAAADSASARPATPAKAVAATAQPPATADKVIR
ncbi:MAG TPA: rod shape-determining protein MreC [Candidatus Eisenbacteria bacterium]|jgi:rod shape-determining protein MreC|nr:rod shape-determining protein MreC [Candidatus Eisenbacteria bacterium]